MKVDENAGSSLIKGSHDSTYLALNLNKHLETVGFTERIHEKLKECQKDSSTCRHIHYMIS